MKIVDIETITTPIQDSPIEDIQSLDNDFSVVEWKIASPELAQRVTDYGALEAVKVLLSGQVLEVPQTTYLNRLYRWLGKNGYSLRRHKVRDVLLIWVEPSVKKVVESPPTTREYESK
jgi:hypothetical protein